ncbi:hypothetical protein AN963_24950 [Brevibacillus choshinensis]|uniref:Uncharacterized protein n=1 Tax=Brevibacillus choshinensis TaxID=54911 RepID=A0ABR5N2W4_BRECH|nr:hypothetical protein AN963_24950 [Brevibacillus choshinensis]
MIAVLVETKEQAKKLAAPFNGEEKSGYITISSCPIFAYLEYMKRSRVVFDSFIPQLLCYIQLPQDAELFVFQMSI